MHIFSFTFGTFGKVEKVVAYTVHFNVFWQFYGDCIAFKIIGFKFGIIRFDLIQIGKDEVCEIFVFLLFSCQIFFIGKFF